MLSRVGFGARHYRAGLGCGGSVELDVEVSRHRRRLDLVFHSPRVLEPESEGLTRRYGDWVGYLDWGAGAGL